MGGLYIKLKKSQEGNCRGLENSNIAYRKMIAILICMVIFLESPIRELIIIFHNCNPAVHQKVEKGMDKQLATSRKRKSSYTAASCIAI